jgi:hypothetical protein
MESMPTWLPQLGAGGLVIFVVSLFLKAQACFMDELKATREERRVERSEWIAMLIANQKCTDAIIEKCTGNKYNSISGMNETKRQDASSLT